MKIFNGSLIPNMFPEPQSRFNGCVVFGVNIHNKNHSQKYSLGLLTSLQFGRILPNAKMIYTYRDPMESIPSTLSLLQHVLNQNSFQTFSLEVQHRYYRQIVMGLIDLYRRFWIEYQNNSQGIYIVNQHHLRSQFSTSIHALFEWLEVPIPRR